jgi:hypothetical protein
MRETANLESAGEGFTRTHSASGLLQGQFVVVDGEMDRQGDTFLPGFNFDIKSVQLGHQDLYR